MPFPSKRWRLCALGLILLQASAFAVPGASGAEEHVLPLQENAWSNPDFVNRFLGTYGVHPELEPGITAEEQALFEAMVPLVRDGRIEEAIDLLENALTPESSAALDYTLGNLRFQQRQTGAALEAYRRALEKHPSFMRAYRNLGRVQVAEGHFAEAIPALSQALQLGGGDADVYGLLAYSFLNTGRPARALSGYEMATLLAPDNRDWRLGQAQAFIRLERHREAAILLRGLIAEDPANRSLLRTLANAYLNEGEVIQAASTLEVLRRSEAADAASLFLLGDIYLNESIPHLALNVYREALAQEGNAPSPEASLRVARALVDRRLTGEAASFLESVEKHLGEALTPAEEVTLLTLRGEIALREGALETAAAHLEEASTIDPTNGEVLLALARLYRRRDDAGTAEYYFERAVRIESVEFSTRVEYGQFLVGQSRYEEALTHLRRAYRLDPSEDLRQYRDAVERAAERGLAAVSGGGEKTAEE